MKLSPHFTLSEMTFSQIAIRKHISNIPSVAEKENLTRLCNDFLEPVRAIWGVAITPTSGYRSPILNEAVGGATNSQHVRGLAVDFNVPGKSPKQVVDAIIAEGIIFDQLILEHNQWCHGSVAEFGKVPRMQALYFDGIKYHPYSG